MKKGFWQLRYKGIEVIIREYVPDDEIWVKKKNGKSVRVNVKTGEVMDLKV